MKYILLLIFVFPLLGLSQYPELAVSQIDSNLLKGANSVVRYDDMTITIQENRVEYSFDYAITVLNKKHADKLSWIESYKDPNKIIKNIEILIVDRNGQLLKKVSHKEIEDRYSASYELITDSRYKYYKFETRDFPVTIVQKHTYLDNDPYYIRTWRGIPDYKVAVENTSLKFINNTEHKYHFKTSQLDRYQVAVLNTHHYVGKGIKALRKEKYSPSLSENIPSIAIYPEKLQYFKRSISTDSWEELGPWVYNEMYLPQQTSNLTDIKRATFHIISDPTDQLKTATELYKYVQDNTRYILVDLHDGGYVPLETKIVHEKKYGDCKALSFYYKSLLEAYGISSDLAFIKAGTEKSKIDVNYVSLVHFNHVINRVYIDHKQYWVDCTSPFSPFNHLSTFNDDREVLISNSTEGYISNTPESLSQNKTKLEINIDEEGSINGELHFKVNGPFMLQKLATLPLYSIKENEKYHREDVFDRYRYDVDIDSFSYRFDSTSVTFIEEYFFNSKKTAEKLGEFLLLSNNHTFLIPKLPKDRNRVFDIEFLRNKEHEITIEIKHPVHFVVQPQENIELFSEFGSYMRKVKTEVGLTTITRKFKLLKGVHNPQKYKKIKAFFDKAKKAERLKITINTKS